MIFDVVSTFVVIDISKGKINTIAIDKPTFVVLSNFLNVFIIYNFNLFICFYGVKIILILILCKFILIYFTFIMQCTIFPVRKYYAMHIIIILIKLIIFVTNKAIF